MGAFVVRWTVPTMLKGTGFVFSDLRQKPHLLVWALLAGMLWFGASHPAPRPRTFVLLRHG